MSIWSAEIKELEKLCESFKGQLPDLEKELGKLIKADDENMILLYSRRCLEVIITDLCECELKRSRKTEPLQGIIDKLNKEEKVPSHIIASMQSLNTLSTFGAHPKDFDPEQIKPVLVNLDIIIKWYLKYKDSGIDIKAKPGEEIKDDINRTEDVKKSTQIPKKKLIGLVAGLIGLIAIVVAVLSLTDIIGGNKHTKEIEKSIAVLPFKSLSADPDKQYLADGMMDEITLHLSKIKDLRVLGRTSTEQYRNPTKTLTAIGKELDVSYLLEGSFQKFGDSVRLIVQLIKTGKEGHVWANNYYRLWINIFSVQSEVAQSIARELKAAITPEEKVLIDKIPTTNLTAYDFYQRGREEESKYSLTNIGAFSIAPVSSDIRAIESANKMYRTAIKYDSTFALAYVGLASVYWNKNYYKEYFSGNFLDSVVILADRALYFDDKLSEAYTLKGLYYHERGKSELAIEEFDKAIKINPNNWMAYYNKGDIKSLQIAASLNHGSELPIIIGSLALAYFDAGFIEEANNNLENLKLIGGTIQYLWFTAYGLHKQGYWEKAIESAKKGYDIDSTYTDILDLLGYCHSFLGQYNESLKYYKKFVERKKALGQFYLLSAHRIGYTYYMNGYKKEAEYYFDKQLEYCDSLIKSDRPWSQLYYTYYDLAGVYAFRGNKPKAYENLKIFNQREADYLWMVSLIKDDPLFESIRNEPQFQQIVRDVELKYNAEHERVRKWLEEQGML